MKLFFLFFFYNASYRGMLAVVISFHNCRGDQNHHGFNFKNYALSVCPLGDDAEICCGFQTGILENTLTQRETNDSFRKW